MVGKERGREERREGRRVRRKRGKEGEREEEGREWCVKGRTALLQRTLQVKSFRLEQELIKKNVSQPQGLLAARLFCHRSSWRG